MQLVSRFAAAFIPRRKKKRRQQEHDTVRFALRQSTQRPHPACRKKTSLAANGFREPKLREINKLFYLPGSSVPFPCFIRQLI
jgi:hypothetical protein